jgi:hexaprenyl-diphosphate synthase
MCVVEIGVVTAPVLFAADEHPALEEMIKRKFSEPGDIDKVSFLFSYSSWHACLSLVVDNLCDLDCVRQWK